METTRTNYMDGNDGATEKEAPGTSSRLPQVNGSACQDVTEDSDDGGDADGSPSNSAQFEDVVGFSMGHEQLRMKSPETPAYEKAKALDQFKGYFEAEHDKDYDHDTPDGIDIFDGAPSQDNNLSLPPLSSSPPSQPTAFPSAEVSRDTGMIGALRKLLPDIPSISSKVPALPKFDIIGSRNRSETQVNRPGRSTTLFAKASLPWISPVFWPGQEKTTETQAGGLIKAAGASDNQRTSGLYNLDPFPVKRLSREKSLRRSTSDSSLFMHHDLTRVETMEGAEKWTNVSDMVNARFKAITDSFQDSSISRMPKIPTINLGISKYRNQDTKETTGLNQGYGATNANFRTSNFSNRGRDVTPSTNDALDPHPILKGAISNLTGDVVILGGYRGSVLRSAKPPNKQLWVPVKVRPTLFPEYRRKGLIKLV